MFLHFHLMTHEVTCTCIYTQLLSDVYVYVHIAIVRRRKKSFALNLIFLSSSLCHATNMYESNCFSRQRMGQHKISLLLQLRYPPPPSPLNTLRCSVWQVNRRGKFSFVVFKTFVIRAREVFFPLLTLSLSHKHTHTHTLTRTTIYDEEGFPLLCSKRRL